MMVLRLLVGYLFLKKVGFKLNKLPNVICISEKPNQARSYANAFQTYKSDAQHYIHVKPCNTFKDGMLIFWGFGHLLGLRDIATYPGKERYKVWNLKDLPLQFPEKMEYVAIEPSKAAHLNKIKKTIREIINTHGIENTTAIVATDSDREGEAIGRTILQACVSEQEYSSMTIKRLWINSLESAEIFKGFNNLRDGKEFELMFEEATTRGKADFIVGLNSTRIYTLLIRYILEKIIETSSEVNHIKPEAILGKTSTRVGRIITPTLHLAYNREKEIESFVEEDFFELHADFTVKNGTYHGKAKVKTKNRDEVERLLSQNGLRDGQKARGVIKTIMKEEKRTEAPKLHSLTSLQTKANKLWKMSPKQTLDTVQSLYENHKLLSYPRSDCQFITTAEYEYLLKHLEGYKQVIGMNFENAYTSPRNKHVNNSAVQEHYAIVPTKQVPTADKLKLLKPNELKIYMEVLRTTVAMFAPDYIYEQTDIITDMQSIEFKSSGKVEISKGFKALWKDEEVKEPSKKSKKASEEELKLPLVHQNEQVTGVPLIHAGKTKPPPMYTEGNLLKAMETCGAYVDDEEDAAVLKQIDGIGTVATRAAAIESLKEANYIIVQNNIVKVTPKGHLICKATEGTLLASPSMTAKWEKFLQAIGEGKKQAGPFIENINAFVENLVSKAPKLVSDQEKLQYFLKVVKDYKEDSTIGTCPKCKKGEVIAIQNKFYGCSNYRNEQEPCKFKLPTSYASKTLSTAQIKSLLAKGKTANLKFKSSKTDKTYEAYLTINLETLKLEMQFPSKHANSINKAVGKRNK